jgi:hypothetical protein
MVVRKHEKEKKGLESQEPLKEFTPIDLTSFH